MAVSFTITIPEKLLRERGVENFGKVQRQLDSDVLNYAAEFVPKDTGNLINSGRAGTKIGSGIICYNAPYARMQYYGISKNGKKLKYRGGGKRGSHWFDRMKATHKYTLLKNAAILAGGGMSIRPVEQYVNSLPLGKIYMPMTKASQVSLFKKRWKR